MDFLSAKELVTQTGHSVDEWPFVILKELIDNALDAAEEADNRHFSGNKHRKQQGSSRQPGGYAIMMCKMVRI